MRSFSEIRFRLQQEAANVWMWQAQPKPGSAAVRVDHLPDPATLKAAISGTAHAAEILQLANSILAGRIPLLGFTLEIQGAPAWRRDYLSGIESEAVYFRQVPYLDPARAGDHKIIWELNRHQHLVILAQAYVLTGESRYIASLSAQLESWFQQNPFMYGINWASALEVAFRAWSWIWVLHLAGTAMEAGLRKRFTDSLYQHGLYLEYNLSFYFSPNTHLLGEAAILHLLGRLLPQLPRSSKWERYGGHVTAGEIDRQMRTDGSHFEQSTYYHVYAVDFFLLHYLLAASVPSGYSKKLIKCLEFLHCLLGPQRRLPLLGDDDGGRLFHPFGMRDQFGRATLATGAVVFDRSEWLASTEDLMQQAVWWIGPEALKKRPEISYAPPAGVLHYADAGLVVSTTASSQLLIDIGRLGAGTAGHSHSDTLSVVLQADGEELLIDPATFTYVGDVNWRNWFRGTAAHNTIRIDGLDQASPAGPFRWLHPPEVQLITCKDNPDLFVEAVCRYRGFSHRRLLLFERPHLIWILDHVDGPGGLHELEQFWHSGVACQRTGEGSFQLGKRALLRLSPIDESELENGGQHGWRSRALGQREPADVLIVRKKTALPAILAAVVDLNPHNPEQQLAVATTPDGSVHLVYGPREQRFTYSGLALAK